MTSQNGTGCRRNTNEETDGNAHPNTIPAVNTAIHRTQRFVYIRAAYIAASATVRPISAGEYILLCSMCHGIKLRTIPDHNPHDFSPEYFSTINATSTTERAPDNALGSRRKNEASPPGGNTPRYGKRMKSENAARKRIGRRNILYATIAHATTQSQKNFL